MAELQDTPTNAAPEVVADEVKTKAAQQEIALKETVFGDDWREKLATKDDGTVDDKLLKQLSRYGSPKESAKALVEAQKKISEGIKKPLGKDATPEQIAEWRKENGIPDAPNGYDLKIDGVDIGESDKPLIDVFLERMHAKNASPELVKEAVKAYYDVQKQAWDAISVQDAANKDNKENLLREEWGTEYAANVSRINNWLDGTSTEYKETLLNSRTPDGVRLADLPEFNKWADSLIRKVDPIKTLTPTGNATVHDMTAEMKALEAKMGTDDYTAADRSRYKELSNVKSQIDSRQ